MYTPLDDSWMDELEKRVAKRRDEKDNYPETEHGKAAGLDEALEIIKALREEIKLEPITN